VPLLIAGTKQVSDIFLTMANAKTPSPVSLEKRVMEFLGRQPGAENIDRLPLTPAQRASEKADFLLEQRSIVCEVKALQTDTKEKIDRILEPVLQRPDAPVFYGEWEMEKVLKNLADGEAIRRKVFEATTSAVWNLFRKANEQIKTTKSTFGVPAAGGVLVLANDLVPILSPQVLVARVNELLGRKEPDGRISYPEVEAVWILAETHVVDIGQGQESVAAITIHREDDSAAVRCLDALQRPWAVAHGMPFVEMKQDLFSTLQFHEIPKSPPPTHGPRDERWRLEYRRKPYLRHHSEAQLKEFFAKLMPAMTVGILKGAKPGQLQTASALMEQFAHFLEELRARGLDFRKVTGGLPPMGPDLPLVADLPGLAATVHVAPKFERDRFYTNQQGKHYRCLTVSGDNVWLLLLDLVAGRSLEVTVRTKMATAAHYQPVFDPGLLAGLETRYIRWAVRHRTKFDTEHPQ